MVGVQPLPWGYSNLPMPVILKNEGNYLPIHHFITLVGRDEEADLIVTHRQVSRKHVILVKNGDHLLVRDLATTNGTHINGKPVTQGVLKNGDILSLGDLAFQVSITADGDQSPSKKHPVKPLKESQGSPAKSIPKTRGHSSHNIPAIV